MKKFSVVMMTLILCSCAMPPQSDQFEAKQIETEHFSIAVWEKKTIQNGEPLRIYFEGDGSPNPYHKVAFDFAQKDKTPNVIYVARPCQWSDEKLCKKEPQIYKEARFHPLIIRDMQELTQYLLRKHKAPEAELIGYDGGAVIALNMAVRVPTQRIITIAGITDVDAYTTYNDLPKMNEDEVENPASQLALLAQIPQVHYVGQNDDITPRRLVERFVGRMQNPVSAVVNVVSGTGHTDWESVELNY